MGSAARDSILTPDQRPRVFISSTLQEMSAERVAARAAVESLGLIPVMFEMGARAHPARSLYRAYLAQSHVFVGLYFQSYGWVAPGESVSGLEDEYQLSRGLPRLVYFRAPAPDRDAGLAALANRIRDDDTVAYKSFDTTNELERLLRQDLAVLLAERFLRADERAPSDAPMPSIEGGTGTPVPRPLSSLVGRRVEIEAVKELLATGSRLVTILGPGGIGKTRLAIEVSSEVSGSLSFVPLEGVADPGSVLGQVSASIGLSLAGGVSPVDALAAALADRRILLVIDNFEQVQSAGADLAQLLERCPGVSMLVTSRIPLKIRGEVQFPLGPLGLPNTGVDVHVADAEAVRLFVDRARAVRPDFEMDGSENSASVVELCRRLDGIPLAIELAAGRSTLLSPQALLDRIGSALDLSAGTTDLPVRQRTLRDTLTWSQQLLTDSQTKLLARLSIFLAPWTLSDAEAVADPASVAVFDDLAGLVESNLVAPAPGAPGEPRFRLYETVRAFAAELLDEVSRDQAERAYMELMSRQAAFLSQRIRTKERQRWQPEFRLVWPDLRKAWQFALDRRDAERTVASAMSLLALWIDGSVLKGFDLLEPSVRLADELRPPGHADMIMVCGQAAYTVGDYRLAASLLTRFGGDLDYPSDPGLAASATLMQAYVASQAGDFVNTEVLMRRALEQFAAIADPDQRWFEGFTHTGMGWVFEFAGDVDGAIAEFAAAAASGRATGNVGAQTLGLVFEADMHLLAGRLDRARELLVPACDLVETQLFFEGNAYCLEAVAFWAAGVSPADAARLLGLADALRAILGAQIWMQLRPTTAIFETDVRSRCSPDEFAAAYAEGRALDPLSSPDLCRSLLARN